MIKKYDLQFCLSYKEVMFENLRIGLNIKRHNIRSIILWVRELFQLNIFSFNKSFLIILKPSTYIMIIATPSRISCFDGNSSKVLRTLNEITGKSTGLSSEPEVTGDFT